MKWLNYHHLIYFQTIASCETISKASEVLSVGQPALSSQLKKFEENLGVKLFERKNKRLHLTEAGSIVLKYANEIKRLGQELLKVVDEQSFDIETPISLNIGAIDSIPKYLICDILDFAHKKTGCFLSIYEDTKKALLKQLEVHKIEAIISDHEATFFERQKVFSKRILKRQISVYAAPKFHHLKKGFPQSLDGVPCILPTKHSKIRHDVEHYFERHKIKPKIIAQTQDTALQKILAVKGDGIIFLPMFTAKEFVQDKKLIALAELKNIYAEYFLIYSKRVIKNPALDLIINQDFQRMQLG